MHRFCLVITVFLLLAACTTVAPSSRPATSPTGSPAFAPTSSLSTALPSPTPTAVPATVAPAPTPAVIPPTASPAPMPKPTVLRVAYWGGGRIMLWTEGKGSHPLTDAMNVEQVRISDDGQVIAYLGRNSRGAYELLAVNADGTNQRLLAGQDYLQNIQPADRTVSFDFAPGSHTVYFVTEQYDLHRANTDSGAPMPVFGGQGGLFSFSPNGQWMVLSHPDELVLARPDGTNARVVFKNPPDSGYILVGPEIIWEPDPAGFHMVSASGPPQDNPDNMTVWFIPVAGEPVKQMSYTGPYGANLSPDGRKVVYLYSQHEPIDVHIVAQNGQNTTYNSYSSKSYINLQFMGWAPDSKHFLLNLSKDGRLLVPYLCAVGEQPVKLTDTDDALPVVWVDAQRVLFASRGATLHLQRVGAPSILLDANASSWFDYTYINP